MEQQQSQQPAQQPVNPAPQQQVPQQSSSSGLKIVLWILGGCLGIAIIIGLVMAGLTWWGVRTAKNKLNEMKPQLEQYSKEMEKQSKSIQEEIEKAQKELPQGIE